MWKMQNIYWRCKKQGEQGNLRILNDLFQNLIWKEVDIKSETEGISLLIKSKKYITKKLIISPPIHHSISSERVFSKQEDNQTKKERGREISKQFTRYFTLQKKKKTKTNILELINMGIDRLIFRKPAPSYT